MKIAIIIDSLSIGGAEKQAVLSAIELARGKEIVELITYHAICEYGNLISKNQIKWTVIGSGHNRVARVLALSVYLRREKFDVVHAFKAYSSLWGCLAAKLGGIPHIFAGYRDLDRKNFFLRLLYRLISWQIDGWIVLSQAAKRIVVEDFGTPPKKVFVVYSAIQYDFFDINLTTEEAKASFGLSPKENIVSIVANLRPEKNHDMFFRMARRVVDSGTSAFFFVAGAGPLWPKMHELCKKYDLEDHVRLLGHCENVPTLLRATDILVITSLREGLCNALIEAGASGIPSVSTKNGGAEEVIVDGRTGFLVPVNDDDAMAYRILRLLNDQSLKRTMGESAKADVFERFSANSLYKSLMQAYCSRTSNLYEKN